MVKNFLKIALRFMVRQRGFSIINILGLTIGITCSLFILLYIYDELSYDKFHPDAEDTYRVGFKGVLEGKKFSSAQTGTLVAEGFKKGIPEIKSTLRMASWETFPVRYQDKSFTESKLLLVDDNFFGFFNFKLIEGHPDSILRGDRKVVMTESTAKRYFNYKGRGDSSPIGKKLYLAQGYTAEVTGIAEDPPLNSHFQFTLLLSLRSFTATNPGDWMSATVYTYFKLKPEAQIERVSAKFNDIIKEKINSEQEHVDFRNFKLAGNELNFIAQPLLDIHLKSQFSDELEPNMDVEYLYAFGSIASFIMLLACINYMNLSTSRSASRAKEVGIRKAVGAPLNRLMAQFLLESYLYIILAFVLSLLLVIALLPVFNFYSNKQLSYTILGHPLFIGITFICILLGGLLAGSYPAFYLSHFNPIEVLKGRLREQLRSYGIRNGMVVFQFFISSVLIVSTLVVYLQMRYIQKANIGFDKGNVINLLHTRNLGSKGFTFKKELNSTPEIYSASYANRLPPHVDWAYIFRPVDSAKEYLFAVYEMDYDHLKTMGYEMADGRFFSPQFPSDSNAVILNQTAARKLGLDGYNGKKLVTSYDGIEREREVIGTIKDFNFQSLKEAIQPLAIVLGPQPNWEMAIRLSGENTEEKITLIKSHWEKFTDAPFEYTFVDKNFEAKHKTEKRIGLIILLFTSLAIFIACLGLFGLATFAAEQRTKEIGIRKVLGATVAEITFMINQDFMRLVGIANLIAWPIAWWLMNSWLEAFAFRISFPWWVFVVAGTLTIAIAFLSISFQAVRAAKGNPVQSLRNE